MKKQKSIKRALILSALSILMCFSMLVGSTFAWFTDSVTSANNKIVSGSLKIDLLLKETDGSWTSIKETGKAIFNYDNWEPGYTDVKILKIENKGTLALKWLAKFVSKVELSELAKVIDVYVKPSDTELSYSANRSDVSDWTYAGTVADFVNTIETTTKGTLKAKEGAYLGIALKMRETAGNEYMDKDLGGAFDIQIIATQLTYEEDSFDDQYDKDATLDFAPVTNMNDLKTALANKEPNILLMNNIETTESFDVIGESTINGAGFTISRSNGFTGNLFTVKPNSSLTVADATLDGGAVWDGNTNNGATATGSLIAAETNAKIILNDGAVLQNNDGANAVNLGTRVGATLTINGGEIVYNRSSSGAVWGGGNITLNSGKINNNTSTGIGGAIRMVGKCNFTMNGGEICNNTAATDGGAIWGYGTNGNSSVYNLNSGKISGNTAGGVGGGIYTGNYSTINLSGDFEICNNTASDCGGLRITNYTIFNMTGGKISGNVSTGNANNSGFYGWCPRLTITGGELADNIVLAGGHTPTVGGDGITGIVNFAIGTNHNTVNLSADFGTIRFTVAEGSNFSAFNFKPAAGYTYTDGDEAKLVCLNSGYETYWDTTTGTFRLQAK